MKNKPILLRISYWWGAIADALMAVLMIFPNGYLRFTHSTLEADRGFAYGLINGAPLMIGWTVLLLWADRKPLERKGVLLITLPVVLGYAAIEIHAVQVGITSLGGTIPIFVMQAALMVMYVASLLHNRQGLAVD